MNETSGFRATYRGRRPEPLPRGNAKRVMVRLANRPSSCCWPPRLGLHRQPPPAPSVKDRGPSCFVLPGALAGRSRNPDPIGWQPARSTAFAASFTRSHPPLNRWTAQRWIRRSSAPTASSRTTPPSASSRSSRNRRPPTPCGRPVPSQRRRRVAGRRCRPYWATDRRARKPKSGPQAPLIVPDASVY